MLPCALSLVLGGCGLFTPEKGFLSSDEVEPGKPSPQGMFEYNVVQHIRCEIRNGLWRARQLVHTDWLKSSGAIVTLKLTAEEQSALIPNASFLTPLVAAQSFTLGIGGSGTANATRVETIQFSYSSAELLAEAKKDVSAGITSCEGFQHGIMIDSDLKIGQFIYDKAVIAGADANPTKLPFSQLQFEITFTAALGGNITPTWKFTKTTVNSGTLFSATRTNVDDVLITIGPLNSDTKALHNAALTAGSTGQAVQSFSH
jgi:hypothetical protein